MQISAQRQDKTTIFDLSGDLDFASYSRDEPVNGKDVSAVVAAMDRNVQCGLSEVLESLDKYFSSRSAVASTVAPSTKSLAHSTLGGQPHTDN